MATKGVLLMENIKAFTLDLQLFASDEDDFDYEYDESLDEGTNDEPDVVDQADDEETGYGDEIGEEGEVAEPHASTQTPEENAKYKKMRLKAEEEARKKLEAEKDELAKLRAELEAERQERTLKEQKLTQDAIWDKADIEGVSESAAKKMLELEVEQELKQLRQKIESVEKQKKELQRDEFYNDIAPQMEEILKTRPDLEPKTVFYYLKGEMGDQLYRKALDRTQKKTVANIQDSMRRRSVPAGASGDVTADTSILGQEGKEMTNAFGVDPRAVAKYVRNAIKRK